MPPKKKTAATNGASPKPKVAQPPHEEIELVAYQVFLERGGAHGHDLEDWLEAERELQKKYTKKPVARKKSAAAGSTIQ